MSRSMLAPALLLLVACDPTGPNAPASADLPVQSAARMGAPALILSSPLQQVLLERPGGEREEAWFQAQVVVGDLATRGAPAPANGVIMVVLKDGPVQQARGGAESLWIRLESATLDLIGDSFELRFEGTATLRDDGGQGTTFPIAGSARPMASNPDCIIWDIVGGKVYDGATFDADARISLRAP